MKTLTVIFLLQNKKMSLTSNPTQRTDFLNNVLDPTRACQGESPTFEF